MIKGKTLLVVHTGLEHKKFIFPKLKKLGVQVIVAHKEITSIRPHVDHWIITDTNDTKLTLRSISSFLKENPNILIDGVVTFWEESTLITSKIAEKLNLIGAPYEAVMTTRNKFLFRNFCHQNGIKAPKHEIIRDAKSIKTIKSTLTFPIVVKPVYGSGSAFVVKVDDKKDLDEIIQYVRSNISSHQDSSEWEDLSIMAEEYIEGDEVDIDMVVQNGKIKFYSITDNYQTKEPFFVEIGQGIPSTLPYKNQKDLIALAEEVLEKLGILNGVIHFEAKSSNNGPVPIEVNVRMGGDEVYTFVNNAWGVDLVEYTVKVALGEYIKISKPDNPIKFLTGEYFLPPYSGIISNLDISPNLKREKGLGEIHFDKKVGDPILAPPEGYEYIGWFTATGKTAKNADDNLEKIKRNIEIRISGYGKTSLFGKTQRKSRFSLAAVNKDLLKSASKLRKLTKTSIKNQRSLKIGIAGNIYNNKYNAVEKELESVGIGIKETLAELGYETTFINFNNINKAISDLNKNNVELIFNVCERINNSSILEPHVAALLDIFRIPYTGSNPFTLALCIDKIRVKKLLSFHNIPTPRWDYVYTLNDRIDDSLRYPLIVKPGNMDNSIGITNDSVVENKNDLQKQIRKLVVDLGGPALIEEYIEGDEYDVSILGDEEDDLRVLPLSRSIFDNMSKKDWHIYTLDMKFGITKPKDKGVIVQQPPKNISSKLQSLVTEMALDTYNILDCHDYGRVEIKIDKNNNPYVLELNPNPSIGKNDSVPKCAELTGMKYGDLLEEIIRMTIRRYKNKPPYYHLQSNII